MLCSVRYCINGRYCSTTTVTVGTIAHVTMLSSIIWDWFSLQPGKLKKGPLEIQHPKFEHSRLDLTESVHEFNPYFWNIIFSIISLCLYDLVCKYVLSFNRLYCNSLEGSCYQAIVYLGFNYIIWADSWQNQQNIKSLNPDDGHQWVEAIEVSLMVQFPAISVG